MLTALEGLDRKTLVRILTEPRNSVVRQFQRLFAMDGVELEFEPDALEAVATEAFLRKTGARGLRSIVEEALLDVMYDIPSRDDVVRCVVSKEVFTEGAAPDAAHGSRGAAPEHAGIPARCLDRRCFGVAVLTELRT